MMLKLKLQCFGHLMQRFDSLEKLWCWEGVGAGGEGDDRGWDVWMASLTRWMWVWVTSGSWWWTGRPGVLRFMGSQRVGHDWATELNWLNSFSKLKSGYSKNISGNFFGTVVGSMESVQCQRVPCSGLCLFSSSIRVCERHSLQY